MTLKEKVAEIMPEKVGEDFIGGVKSCPSSYDFLKGYYDADVEKCFNKYDCKKCWNMEYIEAPVYCDFVENPATDINVGNTYDKEEK